METAIQKLQTAKLAYQDMIDHMEHKLTKTDCSRERYSLESELSICRLEHKRLSELICELQQ